MAEYTTRISDLPENITIQMPVQSTGLQQNRGNGDNENINYVPLNIHPNPYGIQDDMQLPLPQQSMASEKPQLRLPSRDIPTVPTFYTNDEEIQPNYIPKPKIAEDYIKNYEKDNENRIKEHEKEKKKVKFTENLWNELQIPIFIAFLFFLFHMPIMNSLLYKYLSFLSIYNSDGNINFYGLFLKSILFAATYYSLIKLMDFVNEL